MHQANVFVVDDDFFYRSSIQSLIKQESDLMVTATADNGLDALAHIRQHSPDLVLLDIQMPRMNGIECIQQIRAFNNDLPILILTTFDEQEYIVKGLAYGANGYVVKGTDPEQLLTNIRDALRRNFVLPAPIAAKLSQYLLQQQKSEPVTSDSPPFPAHLFTNKEQEIIFHLMNLNTNQEIAEKCFISQGTLRNHLITIYEKLFVSNRLDAIQTLKQYSFEQ